MSRLILAISASFLIAVTPAQAADQYKKGQSAVDADPFTKGGVSGTGIESRDIDMMADQVMRELMTRPDITAQPKPPRVVVDSSNFINNSTQRLDKDMITDALRASLNRAAAGRLRFISREAMALVERERALKREGATDVGTRGMTRATAGVDYQMIGRMTSLEQRDNSTGRTQRRTQVIFELIDLETGELPWTSQPYTILRFSGDDVVYR